MKCNKINEAINVFLIIEFLIIKENELECKVIPL